MLRETSDIHIFIVLSARSLGINELARMEGQKWPSA